MKNKDKKTIEYSARKVNKSFIEERLISYAELPVVPKYLQSLYIGKFLD